ncbi:hypothetical protein M9Y10_005833 [Tritrichomonas musculus]|uniref:BTB domain-containing protein n=1 Tax=Tritrichomonas musculus TaxID=1915356 RepID=A0ABR2JCN6_9EUKA
MTNQTFPIIYQNERFMVDPSYLYDSSKKFQNLINSNTYDLQSIQLRIINERFTSRNISNFLKICQNQQTDVQNSELEEICLIARMFLAEGIYNTCLNFIQSSINPNYSIPCDLINEGYGFEYLILEPKEEIPFVHHVNLNELEFDDSCEFINPETKESANNNNTTNIENQKKKIHSAVYKIIEEIPITKRTRYYMYKDNQIIYMAKTKRDEIFIGKGTDFHISENKIENTARVKFNSNGYNIVNTDEQEFKIEFVKIKNSYSMDISFMNNGQKLHWIPKIPKNQIEIEGEYYHRPIPSKRNIMLQNNKNNPTLIIRKMSTKIIEVECHPAVNPISVFAIALSYVIDSQKL